MTMDEVERGRATKEAVARALDGDGASAPKLLRYLAAEAGASASAAQPTPTAGPSDLATRAATTHRAPRTRRRPTSLPLVALEALIALSAIGGAIGLIGNGAGIPLDWLSRTPFHSWAVPGLLLLALVAVPTG